MTTEESFKYYKEHVALSEGAYEYLITEEDFKKALIEFTRYHVKKAINAVLDEVNMNFIDLDTEDLINLRHAYPLDEIK